MAGSATVGTLRAVLSADTAEFTRAMQNASAEVKALGEKLQKDLEPRQRAINAAVKDFLGTNEIRRANEYAMAVERIGGVSALTAQDQLRVNKAVSDALEHYRAIGQEAPAHLVKLKNETAQVQSVWEKADTALGKFGLSLRGLTVASIGAGIIALGKEAIAFGSKMTDLRDATGLTLQELQRLDYAGDKVGVTVEASASAVQRLQKSLVEDKEGGAAGAMRRLGLDVDALVAMRPMQMFEEISRAVAKIPDPTQRSAAAMQVLKGGADLLPLMVADVDKLAQGMVLMSDRTLEAADRFDDAWVGMKKNLRAEVGEMIGALSSLKGALDFVFNNDGRSASWLVPFERMGQVDEALKQFAETASGPLKQSVPVFGATGKALDELMSASQAMNAETQKAIEAHEAHRQKIQALSDELTGRNLVAKVNDLAAAIALAGKQGGVTEYQFRQVAEQARKLREQGAQLTGELREMAYGLDILDFNQRLVKLSGEALPALLKRIGGEAKLGAPPVVELSQAAKELAGHLKWLDSIADGGAGSASIRAISGLGTVIKDLKQPSKESFGEISQGLTSIAQVAGDEMPDFVRDVFTGITAIDGLRRATDQMARAGAANFASFFSAAAILYQLGQLVPTKMSAEQKRLRDEIANFGGPQLSEEQQIEQRIEDLKRLADSLPAMGSTSMLRTIREALDYWQDKLDRIKETNEEILTAQEEAARALAEENEARDILQKAVEKYGFTIEELGPKWKQQRMTEQAKELVQDFTVLTASGIDVQTVIKRMGDEINEFVRLSMKMGTEVPNEMRPMLEKMIEMGELTDENGEKIENLDDIKFGMTLTEGFQGVIDKLDELIKRLTGDLDQAISKPRMPVVVDIETRQRTVVFPPDYVEGDQPNPNDPFNGVDPGNPPQMAKGGVVRPRPGGTLVNVAEAGYPETILPGDWSALLSSVNDQPAMGSPAVGGDGASAPFAVPTIVVQSYLDGRQIAEGTAKYDGDAARRYLRWRA